MIICFSYGRCFGTVRRACFQEHASQGLLSAHPRVSLTTWPYGPRGDGLRRYRVCTGPHHHGVCGGLLLGRIRRTRNITHICKTDPGRQPPTSVGCTFYIRTPHLVHLHFDIITINNCLGTVPSTVYTTLRVRKERTSFKD